MKKLKEEGLTKYIGLSECNAETLRKADKSEFGSRAGLIFSRPH
jgi:diketogulonate reductase-like aldo/keto reductase